jgi:hypothetical protein
MLLIASKSKPSMAPPPIRLSSTPRALLLDYA